MIISENKTGLKGQAFVERLSKDTLRMVSLNHQQGTPYIDVDLKNQANAEASAMREYRGRYLFELLQNANDAIRAAKGDPSWSKAGLYRVRIELTDSALIIANDGIPFIEKDVDSIYRWGESSKDPNKSIGYKGIGFKSVLEITESPEIFSQAVQFRFDRETCYHAVREIVGVATELKLPITRFVLPYTITEVEPSNDRELVSELLSREEFATVIRLPLRVAYEEVLKRIQEDLDPALLLFLNGIDEIEVWVGRERKKGLRRKVKQSSCEYVGQDVTLFEGQKAVSRWLLFDAPKHQIDNRAIIDELEDRAWERVQRVGFAVAFRLDKRGKLRTEITQPTKLFVYFPTALSTGLRYRIHGDFYIDAARKQVGDRAYNKWLAQRIASFLSSNVVPELIQRFPGDARVVQALVPCAEVSEFAACLRNAIYEELRDCPFVPTASGEYKTPTSIMLAPVGASVDVVEFQRFFPTAELSKRHGGCHFPIPSIESDEQISGFLIELGAKRLTFGDVFRLLDGREMVDSPAEYPALYRFLWNWREELSSSERSAFSEALQRSRCIVVDDGSWIMPHHQLYHAKLRQETPNMPRAIRADLVHPLAYDPDGRAGPTYKLLDTLEPRIRDYDAPDIIRNAIISLFHGERFKRLPLKERAEVYRYLIEYWRTRRGGGDPDVERLKGLIQVPARFITNRRRDVWLPANQVYLSSIWSGDKRLEQLYDGFEGVAFLYQVRGLGLQPDEHLEWAQFWEWLGVAVVPRFVVYEVSRADLCWGRWSTIRRNHPHGGTELWLNYLDQIKAEYSYCPSHGSGYRQLRRSTALEGFAELIERRDGEKLALLYELLAENWLRLRKSIPAAEVHCYRKGCPQYARSREIPSFFDYLLRNAEWIPALTNIEGAPQLWLQKPNRCWFVSPAESPVIRNLLSTPPADLYRPEHRQFCRDIGMRFVDEARLEDLVDILRHLPERYPDPNIAVSSGRRAVPRALATLSRWVIERINNLLAPLGDDDWPQPNDTVPLVSREGDSLRYVYPPEPVFFADDRYHAARWRQHLPFAPMDDNWRDAAQYLGLKSISEHVEESCTPGMMLDADGKRLENRFKKARPYMLAAVYDRRESRTQDVARYLSNLEIVVVDGLVVHRRLTIPPEKVIADTEAHVYLEETTAKRVGSAGRAPRSGTLYVRKGLEQHYDLLAGPIAEFIRIPGLADAFVILLDRGGKDGRLRYLSTRGLSEEHVCEMRAELRNLGVADELESTEEDPALNRHLLRQLHQGEPEQPTSPPEPPETPPPDDGDQGEETEAESIQFPPLDLSQVHVSHVGTENGVLPPERGRQKRKGGGGRWRDWEHDQRLRDAYGERGERLVKMLELERLRDLGVEMPEQFVRWLRQEGNLTADHDLESKDLRDGKWVDIVIEVKATPARDFRFPMSRGELICAQHYLDRYQLYRIIDVASASPQVYVFENPFTLWKEGRSYIEPRDTYVILPDPRKHDANDQNSGE